MNQYKTIEKPTEGIYKEKGSKFIAFAFPVATEEAFKEKLAECKKEYHDARHHCYAFRIGADLSLYRYSDDGEPNNTAGKPIYGQIQSFELTNVAIIVIRYFGGTKLGVGGLITAYKEAAKDALEKASVITKEVTKTLSIQFQYDKMNVIMNLIKTFELEIVKQNFEMVCEIELSIPVKVETQLINSLEIIQDISYSIQ